MPKIIEIAGQRFAKLTVIKRVTNDSSRCICKCDCGTVKEYSVSNVRSLRTKSCGCIKSTTPPHNKSHDMTNTSTYKTWCHMIYRCNNPSSKSYPDYGGRGISVCDRWLTFENFLSDMGERPGGLTIDRIDNDGNYEKQNCRWATKKKQANNRRTSKLIEYNQETYTMSELATISGLPLKTFWSRFNSGWDIDRIMKTPAIVGRNQFTT